MRLQTLIMVGMVSAAVVTIGCKPDKTPLISNTAANAAGSTPDHSAMGHGPSGHSMDQASKTPVTADYDLQFIDTMIEHHQAAIDMAKLVGPAGGRAELRKLGTKIGATQQVEIDNMRSWRDKWFAGQPKASNHDLAGMADSMKDMDMKKLGAAAGSEFDLEFIKQMIPHHEGAVVMAREALARTRKPEIKKLAEDVIREQQAEIEMMRNWQKQWAGK